MRTKKYLRYLSLVVVFSMVFCIISPMATYNAENEEISASEDLLSVEDLPIIEDVRVSEYSRLPRKLKFLIKIDDGTNEI